MRCLKNILKFSSLYITILVISWTGVIGLGALARLSGPNAITWVITVTRYTCMVFLLSLECYGKLTYMGYSDCGTLFYYTGRMCGLACLERALKPITPVQLITNIVIYRLEILLFGYLAD